MPSEGSDLTYSERFKKLQERSLRSSKIIAGARHLEKIIYYNDHTGV